MIKHRNHHLIFFLFLILLITGLKLKAQQTYKVLFLGNSYTYVNNLPQIVHDLAISVGDTLVFDSSTPGGYQLRDHVLDSVSQSKIMAGGWDYVVLQGQSQEPITFSGQFNGAGQTLYNTIKQYNFCAVPLPYMTWGRKNGDASNCASIPVMCTYQGMDTTLRDRYISLSEYLNCEVAPVSVVWNYLRQNFPGIELYQADESHPSLAGSYAAACCFYAMIFKKDPGLTIFNSSLSASDAMIIRNAAKTIVFDNLSAWDFKQSPVSDFRYHRGSGINEVIFSPVNYGIKQAYAWDFGDGTSASSIDPTHSYLADGTYTVSLTTTKCDLQGMHSSTTDTIIQFCSHTPIVSTTNPWLCNYDTLWTQAADSYQWLSNGIPLPETNQYLENYSQYNVSGFSVISTVNTCSELSEAFNETPLWSGYFFDGIGDPCAGDTVAFVVLHVNGFLSGFEHILWYKNDTLMPWMNNEDTLLITGSGIYECKVVNPNSDCALDTTSALVEYDCDVTGIDDYTKEFFRSVFPNPASETITVKISNLLKGQIQIYSAYGQLIRSIPATETTQINISDLPQGLYIIRLKNNGGSPIKFIKQ
jgi:PKD repeat protein